MALKLICSRGSRNPVICHAASVRRKAEKQKRKLGKQKAEIGMQNLKITRLLGRCPWFGPDHRHSGAAKARQTLYDTCRMSGGLVPR